ncbi:hypothetical protein Pth03_52920 [Planotetraspora thailandica]|uniref:Uncharacterized protein n=1 Tax=Planotetraspora thailandica TaxID=487172 RepID=A0A8J3V544_9ACTN|nr:hypothetical protein Pth03_52920 [Planotetraspora thailandica]
MPPRRLAPQATPIPVTAATRANSRLVSRIAVPPLAVQAEFVQVTRAAAGRPRGVQPLVSFDRG